MSITPHSDLEDDHDLPGEVGRVHLGEVPALDDVLVQLPACAEWEDHAELAAHLNHADRKGNNILENSAK
jgi:hypothetical protein